MKTVIVTRVTITIEEKVSAHEVVEFVRSAIANEKERHAKGPRPTKLGHVSEINVSVIEERKIHQHD